MKHLPYINTGLIVALIIIVIIQFITIDINKDRMNNYDNSLRDIVVCDEEVFDVDSLFAKSEYARHIIVCAYPNAEIKHFPHCF